MSIYRLLRYRNRRASWSAGTFPSCIPGIRRRTRWSRTHSCSRHPRTCPQCCPWGSASWWCQCCWSFSIKNCFSQHWSKVGWKAGCCGSYHSRSAIESKYMKRQSAINWEGERMMVFSVSTQKWKFFDIQLRNYLFFYLHKFALTSQKK